MKQEDKKLLLKDLCTRLLYGVKIKVLIEEVEYNAVVHGVYADETVFVEQNPEPNKVHRIDVVHVSEVKPYLFPLSSITEEQYESLRELGILSNCSHSYEYINPYVHGVSFVFKEFKTYSLELIEWLNKNHFDYRGLIEKGLAINATGLNIY